MALRITAQLGTDRGITSEAYVRIADYQLNKYGSASFRIELFQSEEDASPILGAMPGMYGGTARNQQIGENIYVALSKQVEETVTRTRMVNVAVVTPTEQEGPLDEEGNPTTVIVDVTTYEMQEEEYEDIITKTVPDLSSAEGVDIFEFGYSHLKTKLIDLFGEENIVDC
jgi:hypothetical protein